jgi:hypothetical protein
MFDLDNGGDRTWGIAMTLHGDHTIEERVRGCGDAVEEQLSLRTAETCRAAAGQDVAVQGLFFFERSATFFAWRV